MLCRLDRGFGPKADFCLCYEAVDLILKMSFVSLSMFVRGCGFDTSAGYLYVNRL